MRSLTKLEDKDSLKLAATSCDSYIKAEIESRYVDILIGLTY